MVVPSLRQAVRSYYRVRYFPRRIFDAFSEVTSALRSLDASVEEMQSLQGETIRRVDVSLRRHAERIGQIEDEIKTYNDDTTVIMLNLGTELREVAARAEVISQLRDTASKHEDRLGEVEQTLGARLSALDGLIRSVEASVTDKLGRHETALSHQIATVAATVHSQGEALAGLRRHMETVERRVEQQTELYPVANWNPDAGRRVRTILRLLAPQAPSGIRKIHVGRDYDGGYVMLDAFDGMTTALSLGISDDVSWDLEIAERGLDVLQYDPTVSGPPVAHPRFRFAPLRVGPCDGDGFVSLSGMLDAHGVAGDAILKIDIEGAEWDVFAATPEATLARFQQILCEFHTLDRLGETDFGDRAREVFAKLARTHFVAHVHGNNCGNFANVANVMVPQSLEVCFASRARFQPTGTDEVFPTPLDRPNERGRADLYLGRFRFDEP